MNFKFYFVNILSFAWNMNAWLIESYTTMVIMFDFKAIEAFYVTI
jgi:hypothetical protein